MNAAATVGTSVFTRSSRDTPPLARYTRSGRSHPGHPPSAQGPTSETPGEGRNVPPQTSTSCPDSASAPPVNTKQIPCAARLRAFIRPARHKMAAALWGSVRTRVSIGWFRTPDPRAGRWLANALRRARTAVRRGPRSFCPEGPAKMAAAGPPLTWWARPPLPEAPWPGTPEARAMGTALPCPAGSGTLPGPERAGRARFPPRRAPPRERVRHFLSLPPWPREERGCSCGSAGLGRGRAPRWGAGRRCEHTACVLGRDLVRAANRRSPANT